MLASNRRTLKRVARHALDFSRCVAGNVACARVFSFATVLVLPEINISRKFAHDFKIALVDSLLPQRRNSLQRWTQLDTPQVDVQTKLFAQAQQTSLRTLIQWQRVPLRPANRAKKNRVRRAASRESLIGKRHTPSIDGSSPKSQFVKFEFVLESGSAVAQ